MSKIISSDRINKYFTQARDQSMIGGIKTYHVGAILVYKNKVISTGYNSDKENPMQKYYNKYRNFDTSKYKNSIHAEMMCLNRARHMNIDWGKVSMFVYREYIDGTKAMCRPCKSCMRAIMDFGIKNIYYTTPNGFAFEKIDTTA